VEVTDSLQEVEWRLAGLLTGEWELARECARHVLLQPAQLLQRRPRRTDVKVVDVDWVLRERERERERESERRATQLDARQTSRKTFSDIVTSSASSPSAAADPPLPTPAGSPGRAAPAARASASVFLAATTAPAAAAVDMRRAVSTKQARVTTIVVTLRCGGGNHSE
jgi:hypothetical protein